MYHSWLTFVLLIWANLIWIMPNQRKNMLNSSPFLVIYAELLLLAQYLYGMKLTDDELPSTVNVSYTPNRSINNARLTTHLPPTLDYRHQPRPDRLHQVPRLPELAAADQVAVHHHVLDLAPSDDPGEANGTEDVRDRGSGGAAAGYGRGRYDGDRRRPAAGEEVVGVHYARRHAHQLVPDQVLDLGGGDHAVSVRDDGHAHDRVPDRVHGAVFDICTYIPSMVAGDGKRNKVITKFFINFSFHSKSGAR